MGTWRRCTGGGCGGRVGLRAKSCNTDGGGGYSTDFTQNGIGEQHRKD